MIQFVLWKWEQHNAKTAYLSEHVNVMCSMIRRNMQGIPHRIICITDKEAGITECETFPLWDDFHDVPNASGRHLPSCYRRLKLYDPETQKDLGIDKGDRICGIDIDTLITGHLRQIVDTEGRYVGWHLTGYGHDKVFNGSLQMFYARDLSHIWEYFDPKTSPREANDAGFRGSDQAWLSYHLIGRDGSVGLEWPLVASYPLQNRIMGVIKPETRIVFFHGSEKPWTPNALFNTPWIERYWRL